VPSNTSSIASSDAPDPQYLKLIEFESGKEESCLVETCKEPLDVKQIAANLIFNSKNETAFTRSLTRDEDYLRYVPLELITNSTKPSDDLYTKTLDTRYTILDTTKTHALHLTINSFRLNNNNNNK
jgi:hypothetical protein